MPIEIPSNLIAKVLERMAAIGLTAADVCRRADGVSEACLDAVLAGAADVPLGEMIRVAVAVGLKISVVATPVDAAADPAAMEAAWRLLGCPATMWDAEDFLRVPANVLRVRKTLRARKEKST